MQASDVKLVAITGEQREQASVKDICRKLISNGEISDPYSFNGKEVSAVSGNCEMFDLSKEIDRIKYSDIIAKAVVNSSDVYILWEERVKIDGGGLIIYLCYVSSTKTPSGFIK